MVGTINRCAWQPALFFRLSTGLALRRIVSGMAGKAARRDAVYRFWPTYRRYPDALLARIMACRPLVSLNRQKAEIAAERFALSAEITTLGKQWQEKFAAPLIVRLDKEGAWYFSNDASGCIPAFPTQVVDTIGAGDSHAGGVLAGWPLVCHWRMPYYWAMQWRRGLSGIGAVIVRQRARNYSSHTKRIDRCDSG